MLVVVRKRCCVLKEQHIEDTRRIPTTVEVLPRHIYSLLLLHNRPSLPDIAEELRSCWRGWQHPVGQRRPFPCLRQSEEQQQQQQRMSPRQSGLTHLDRLVPECLGLESHLELLAGLRWWWRWLWRWCVGVVDRHGVAVCGCVCKEVIDAIVVVV